MQTGDDRLVKEVTLVSSERNVQQVLVAVQNLGNTGANRDVTVRGRNLVNVQDTGNAGQDGENVATITLNLQSLSVSVNNASRLRVISLRSLNRLHNVGELRGNNVDNSLSLGPNDFLLEVLQGPRSPVRRKAGSRVNLRVKSNRAVLTRKVTIGDSRTSLTLRLRQFVSGRLNGQRNRNSGTETSLIGGLSVTVHSTGQHGKKTKSRNSGLRNLMRRGNKVSHLV
nr:MAG TPA: hypothetical protein [Caudoviricetes sp.]